MTPNELLLWLSARKQGSWPQFRGAVENLDLAEDAGEGAEDSFLPLHQRVRYNLSRLGHVEFDVAECSNGWRVVPPSLALTQHGGDISGILCGARTLKLLEGIERAARGFALERIPQPDCPDVIRMRAPEADLLMKVARQQGIFCQPDTPTDLLSHLPRVDAGKNRKREPMPGAGKDWDVRHLVIAKKTAKWQKITVQEANASATQGLFRFTRFQIPQYFLREGRETFALPGAIGKYYLLSRRHRGVLRFDRKARSLSMPAIFRPPLLTERALILCSGYPPSISVAHGRPRLSYRDIPEEVAGMAAEVLRQELT